ncbi:TQXA domain-containing protein [Streptomyces sp. HNM0575]|uniref:thioester domain-containing protein n=1 Tax=Streptomyces sp. HNM0575 TaxID=2716338 RepID=UPI00145E2990|nr:thioester domain-containing protein [Streptomyces sp. HNM0575]NLU71429.1 TQXA domain-containing protein [Streptomyces sp. HNM0575]
MRFVRGAVTVVSGHAAARAARRLAAVSLVTVLLTAGAAATAVPAAAASDDEPSRQGGATATLEGLKTYGQAVVHESGEELTTGAGLFEMAVDGGGRLQTYGLDVDNPTQQHARYGETDWGRTSLHDNPEAGRILWILRHSYPQVDDLQALAKTARAGKLSPRTAAAGTQVAIWRFTDGPSARRGRAGGTGEGGGGGVRVEAADPAAEKLADHLQRSARRMAEPRASLSLDPATLPRRSGSRLGPFTVRASAPGVAVSQTPGSGSPGARIVGRDGKPVTSARNGAQLYFDVPQGRRSGQGSLTVQAATKVPVGRALTGVGGHAGSQAQILAGSSRSMVSASADVHWAAEGAIPAVKAEKSCAGEGVGVTVANAGDRPFRFRLAGREHAVDAADSRTFTVPVREDQAYRIPLTGPHGLEKTFTGVLDCATRSSVPVTEAGEDADGPGLRTATVGGGDAGAGAAESSAVADGGDLADTGASGTPLIAGTAVGLVVLGAMAVLVVRRKNPDDGGVQKG